MSASRANIAGYRIQRSNSANVGFESAYSVSERDLYDIRDHILQILQHFGNEYELSSQHRRTIEGHISWTLVTRTSETINPMDLMTIQTALGPGHTIVMSNPSVSLGSTTQISVVVDPRARAQHAQAVEDEMTSHGSWSQPWRWHRSRIYAGILSSLGFSLALWIHTHPYDDAFASILPLIT